MDSHPRLTDYVGMPNGTSNVQISNVLRRSVDDSHKLSIQLLSDCLIMAQIPHIEFYSGCPDSSGSRDFSDSCLNMRDWVLWGRGQDRQELQRHYDAPKHLNCFTDTEVSVYNCACVITVLEYSTLNRLWLQTHYNAERKEGSAYDMTYRGPR